MFTFFKNKKIRLFFIKKLDQQFLFFFVVFNNLHSFIVYHF